MDLAFSEASEAPGRASPLSPHERRAMIIDAVIPLLLEHGATITTRQIAEGVGLAEGTLFRAFGDKESLITAAAAHYFDPTPLHSALRSIDRTMSLDDTTAAIIDAIRDRLSGVFRMMAAMGGMPRQPDKQERAAFAHLITEVLAPHADELAWPGERVGHAVRLITFAASIPEFNAGMEFTTRELTALVLRGLTSPIDCTES
ncbi:MAG: TetR/AcrR family transcriptional regulator [Microbacteriaceae bacterium]